jgi:hypothetical protein
MTCDALEQTYGPISCDSYARSTGRLASCQKFDNNDVQSRFLVGLVLGLILALDDSSRQYLRPLKASAMIAGFELAI